MSSSSPGHRAGGPARRRTISPVQKLDHLTAYEEVTSRNEGGAYLREQGIYSSQITEWRKLRDTGVLAGKKPGEKLVGVPTCSRAGWMQRCFPADILQDLQAASVKSSIRPD